MRISRLLGLLAVGLALAARGDAVAGPQVTYDPERGGVALVRKSEIDGPVKSQFEIAARGTEEVSNVTAVVTGVLFQAEARPAAGLDAKPIRLSYALRGKDDASLIVKYGDQQLASDAPAWVWAVAARFAVHPATAAVTLRNAPETAGEKLFYEHWKRKYGEQLRLTWARYHPELDDTLIGFHLIVADAMMADAEQYCQVVNGLDGDHSTSSPGEAPRRLRSARTLAALVRLESKPADCSMLNDVASNVIFSAADGTLQIEGAAHYQFARLARSGKYEPLKELSDALRKNRHLQQESSPALYRAVDEFSRLVAFFNYVERIDPTDMQAFAASLNPVLERIPTIDTPIGLPMKLRKE